MLTTLAASALRYSAAFSPAPSTFARRVSSLRASDNDFDDFSSKVSSIMSNLNFTCRVVREARQLDQQVDIESSAA